MQLERERVRVRESERVCVRVCVRECVGGSVYDGGAGYKRGRDSVRTL